MGGVGADGVRLSCARGDSCTLFLSLLFDTLALVLYG